MTNQNPGSNIMLFTGIHMVQLLSRWVSRLSRTLAEHQRSRNTVRRLRMTTTSCTLENSLSARFSTSMTKYDTDYK